MREIHFPNSITEIGEYCLEWSDYLETITLPKDLKVIPDGFAMWCQNLNVCEIPDGVEVIGERAFERANSMTRVFIPASVRQIGADAFTALVSLEAFEVDPANSHYKSADGLLLDKSGKTLVAWPFARHEVVVPEGIERLAGEVFNWGFELTSVQLPSTLKELHSGAFHHDRNLTMVTVNAVEPPECDDTEMFTVGVYNNAPLYVPAESIQTYRDHPVWGKFADIRGIGTHGIDSQYADSETPEFFTPDGKRVASPGRGQILIRRQNGESEKIVY